MFGRRGHIRAGAGAIDTRQDPPTLDEDGGKTRYYLLFAGTDAVPRGGLSDLVGTFTSEVAARRAFRDIRLKETSKTSWAQLAVVDDARGTRTLSWFGIGAAPSRNPVLIVQ